MNQRSHSRTSFVGVMVAGLLAACAGPSEPPQPKPEPDKPEPSNAALAHLADEWRSEIIQLPSEFAPGLPKGVEELRFAPGMYEEGAVDYWSYAFVLRFEDRVLGEKQLRNILDQYYSGLITAVAKGRGLELAGPAATTVVEHVRDGYYHADVRLIDAFVTGKPITAHMDILLRDTAAGTNVLAAVSPQPRAHEVWNSLRAVREAIE